MNLDSRKAGALTAIGAAVFVLGIWGSSRVASILQEVSVDLPGVLFDCCGCFGIGAFVVPLGLLAMTLFRQDDTPTDG